MKYKTTDRAIRAGYSKIIKVGNDNLQNLLRLENAVAYNTRAEGWKYDIYDFGSVAICTGYAPIGNYNANYEICRTYDEKALEILRDCRKSYKTQKEEVSALIQEFIAEVTAA